MTRTQIYIPEQDLLEAQIFAKSMNINLSQLLREALKNEINRLKKESRAKSKKLKTVKIPGGKVDLSTNHNEIYD